MKGAVRLSSGTIVHKRKLVLERMQHSRTTCQEGGSNNDAGTVNRADYGTIAHKRKLVLELMQRGFPTNCPSRGLALYGYLRRIGRYGTKSLGSFTTASKTKTLLAREKLNICDER
jgi:hypothetical protein